MWATQSEEARNMREMFQSSWCRTEMLAKRKITVHHVDGVVHTSLGAGATHVDALQQAGIVSPNGSISIR